ncbi:MAG: DegT/DnrJ/EryC1/StrS family aminotransferase [Patescibacteria group bacterium]|nr:DegT/DnrJ/EryC1/StrS family aminotransferase [Patescibacteria group bacterium]
MSDRRANRREFLGTMGAVGAASTLIGASTAAGGFLAEKAEKLAIDGGVPVRTNALGSGPYGPQYYDEVEEHELLEVLRARSPFRHAGGKVVQFEREYAEHIGAKFVLGVTSGTTALFSAMAAMEVGPGDEVILPAWNWYADYDVIVLSGALPVFAEVDNSFGIDPADLERHITPRTKVIIAAHLEGCPCQLDAVMEIARKHKIRVLEDCAQCAGGKYKGRYVGTIGDMGINSFQLSKTITAGEGGAVITSDPVLFERACRFHDVGVASRAYSEAVGNGVLAGFASCNFRMNEFTGAVLRGQLQKLEIILAALRGNAKKVREGIADLPGLKLRESGDLEGDLGMRVFLDMRTRERRDQFLRAIRAEGISANGPGGSAILPTSPRVEGKATIHPSWPSFSSPEGKAIQYGAACCPKTIDVLNRHAGVTIGPKYTEEDVADIIKAIRKVYLAMHVA